MKVTRQGTTFLVDINVSSESPRKAALIANAIAEGYFEEQVRAKNDATRIASNWLNGQIDGLKSRVVASEKAVEDFRSANNLTVSQGVTVNDQQITDLNNQLIGARVQTAEARAKFDQAQQLTKSGSDPGGINAAISSDMITKLRTQYAEIAKNEADLSSKYGPRHPLVANVHAQLRDTQRLINEEIQRILQSTRHDYDVAHSREASLAAKLRPVAGRFKLFRPGAGTLARIAARGRGQPHALRILPRPLQGNHGATESRDAGLARGHQGQHTDRAVLAQDACLLSVSL